MSEEKQKKSRRPFWKALLRWLLFSFCGLILFIGLLWGGIQTRWAKDLLAGFIESVTADAGDYRVKIQEIDGLLPFSLELRFKITESIGLVPFLDAGTVYLNTIPDFGSQNLYYGTGLGLRYYTAIGPIRLDVATPINWREGVDSRYQIYVSIGQAF